MLIVISYDIGDDRRRSRVSKLLEGFGTRVLESVFECDLTAGQWQKLWRRLARRLKADEDRLRAYFLCETCVARTTVVGGGATETSASTYIV